MLSFDKFQAAAASLGGAVDCTLHAALLTAWAEPARFYHTQQHLYECLTLAHEWSLDLDAHDQAVLTLAIWFHDAVYVPGAVDNERQSANWAVRALTESGLASEEVSAVERLVLATEHTGTPPAREPLVDLMLDVDLAILGASKQRFQEYQSQVRHEYAFVPDAAYQVGRFKVLDVFRKMLINRDNPLYRTESGRALIPAAARNLGLAL